MGFQALAAGPPACHSNAEGTARCPEQVCLGRGGQTSSADSTVPSQRAPDTSSPGLYPWDSNPGYKCLIPNNMGLSQESGLRIETGMGMEEKPGPPPCSPPYFCLGVGRSHRSRAPLSLLALALSIGLEPVCWAHQGSLCVVPQPAGCWWQWSES